ncbi:hypothetical protein QG37_02025 [Candidozyma auris]|nr:hypothetical protein QG37_02025 [[Candida] auris]
MMAPATRLAPKATLGARPAFQEVLVWELVEANLSAIGTPRRKDVVMQVLNMFFECSVRSVAMASDQMRT